MTATELSSSINGAMDSALKSGILCTRFVSFATELNATYMSSPANVKSAEAICTDRTLTLTATIISSPDNTAAPEKISNTNSESLQSPTAPKKNIPLTSIGVGIIGFIALVGVMRLLSSCYSLYAAKREKVKGGHLYDILVILNSEEEAILENISHEDIVFYRLNPIEDVSNSTSSGWTMNASSNALERHSEVQFFDKCDLLAQSGLIDKENRAKPACDTKIKTSTGYMDMMRRPTQIGIIVKVKAAQFIKRIVRDKSKAGERERETLSSDASDLDSCVSTPTRVKSVHVSGQQSGMRKTSRTHVGGVFNNYEDDSSDGYTTADTSHPISGY